MKWYSKYIKVYEKPVSEVPFPIIEEVHKKLAKCHIGALAKTCV